MDNITHTLTGIALSQSFFRRRTRFATAGLVIASNLPDIDLAWSFGPEARYLHYHRGITHSVLGVVVLGALLFAVIYALGRRSESSTKPPALRLRPGWLLAACITGTAGHLLMDFSNGYGVRPFLPFSSRWYAWDIMPIIDPLLLAILLLALLLPFLLRLVSEEVGVRKPSSGRGALAGLVLMMMLLGLRDFAHRRVLNMVDAHSYGGEDPRRAGAFPASSNPFAWKAVIQTDSAYHVLAISALADEADPDRAKVLFRDQFTASAAQAFSVAMKTQTATVFADFARFLWPQVEPEDGGYQVTLHDLRFGSSGFIARIRLDQNLRVVSQRFSFTGR